MSISEKYRKIAREISATMNDEELWFRSLTEAEGNYETASVLHDKYVVEELLDYDGQLQKETISYRKFEQLSWAAKRIAKLFGWIALIIILIISVILFVNL